MTEALDLQVQVLLIPRIGGSNSKAVVCKTTYHRCKSYPILQTWARSLIGKAPALQAVDWAFNSPRVHQFFMKKYNIFKPDIKEEHWITDYMEVELRKRFGPIDLHDQTVIIKVIDMFNNLCKHCRESEIGCQCWNDM